MDTLRTCIACRKQAPQDSLIRFELRDGVVQESTRPYTGRGCYVCSADCLNKAIDKKLFARGFKRAVDSSQLAHHAADACVACVNR